MSDRMPRRFRWYSHEGRAAYGAFIPGPPGYNGQAIACIGGFVSCQEREAPRYFPGFAWIDPPGGVAPDEKVRRLRRLLARVAGGVVGISPVRGDTRIRDVSIAVGEEAWAEIARIGREESRPSDAVAPPTDAAATLVTIDDGPGDEVHFDAPAPPPDPTAELVKVLADFLEYLKGRDARRSSE